MKWKVLYFACLIGCLPVLTAHAQTLFFFSGGTPSKWGIKDKNGKIMVEPKYDDYRPEYNGYGMVKLGNGWDLVDGSGKEVTGFKYERINFFSKDGLALVGMNGKFGFLDTGAKIAIPITFDYVESFSDGMAVMRQQIDGTYRYGYINTTGKVTILPKYEVARAFVDGLAEVKLNGKFGYINKADKPITPFKYDYVGLFYEGLAFVSLDKKIGYVDKTGKEVIPLKYDSALPFSNGKAQVKLNGRAFSIDKNGNELNQVAAQTPVPKAVQQAAVEPGKEEFVAGYAAYKANNFVEAHKKYIISAEKGYAPGMIQLGLLYYQGQGVEKNIPTAAKWFLKAANQGNREAMYIVGMGYSMDADQLFPRDNKIAEQWFLKAANLGDAKSMNRLGLIYEFGLVGLDLKKAKEWYQKAANLGNADAKKALEGWGDKDQSTASADNHFILARNEELKKNYKVAYEHYLKAADMGHINAMYNVGLYNELGQGVVKNIELAKKYYMKAKAFSHLKSREALIRIADAEAAATVKVTAQAPPTPVKPIVNQNVSYLGKNGLYGIADRNGKVIVAPQYDFPLHFNEKGFASVRKNKLYGIVNNVGKEIVPIIYGAFIGFSEGLFYFSSDISSGAKHTLVDVNGKEILKDTDAYTIGGPMYSGLALVKTKTGLGYVDRTGNMAIKPGFATQGFLNLTSSYWFTDGVAVVLLQDKTNAVIDKAGKILTKKSYRNISGNTNMFDFSGRRWEGFFIYEVAEKKMGYLDKAGNELTATIYTRAEPFADGLGKVTRDNKIGYVDKTGKEVIAIAYDAGRDFSAGLAAVVKDNKWGYIDKKGAVVIPFQFDNASEFSEGVAKVTVNRKSGFINRIGQWVIAPQYDGAVDFKDGMAGVSLNGRWGFINKAGKLMVPAIYATIGFSNFSDGVVALQNAQDKYVYVDRNGREFIDK